MQNIDNNVQNTSEVTEKVRDLIYNNDDVYDGDIDKIVDDIIGEEFKDADFDDDEVYDKHAERLEQLYEEVHNELENRGYIRNRDAYDYKDASYIPSSERLEQAKNDLNITYGERPNSTLQVEQMYQIRENIDDIISDIETPENISISKTESKSSADATYIDVYNEATDESKTIRVANHYKEGVSGKADYNIYISDYNTIEELNKAIENTISKAQKATENTQTLQPNIENTTGNGYNQVGGVENGRRDGEQFGNIERNRVGLLQLVDKESRGVAEAEKKIQAKMINDLSDYQKEIVNKTKNKYGKTLNYFDGTNDVVKGLATPNGIYLDNQTSEKYGSEFMRNHEIAEDMLSNHTGIVINDYNKMVEKIKNSEGFTNLFQDYTEGMTSKQKQQLALNLDKVAKEILCDINAGKNGTNTELAKIVTDTIKNNLEPQLYNDIIEMFNKYENQIYGKENSTQGSFLLPTSEELQAFDNEQSKKAYESLHIPEKYVQVNFKIKKSHQTTPSDGSKTTTLEQYYENS